MQSGISSTTAAASGNSGLTLAGMPVVAFGVMIAFIFLPVVVAITCGVRACIVSKRKGKKGRDKKKKKAEDTGEGEVDGNQMPRTQSVPQLQAQPAATRRRDSNTKISIPNKKIPIESAPKKPKKEEITITYDRGDGDSDSDGDYRKDKNDGVNKKTIKGNSNSNSNNNSLRTNNKTKNNNGSGRHQGKKEPEEVVGRGNQLTEIDGDEVVYPDALDDMNAGSDQSDDAQEQSSEKVGSDRPDSDVYVAQPERPDSLAVPRRLPILTTPGSSAAGSKAAKVPPPSPSPQQQLSVPKTSRFDSTVDIENSRDEANDSYERQAGSSRRMEKPRRSVVDTNQSEMISNNPYHGRNHQQKTTEKRSKRHHLKPSEYATGHDIGGGNSHIDISFALA